jgi:hypothetical protein
VNNNLNAAAPAGINIARMTPNAWSNIPLVKSKRVIDHDIKVMFGNFRNSGTRKKMAIGRL